MYMRMSRKGVNFDDKKLKEVTFPKIKKYFKSIILMLIKHYFLKKNHMVHRIHLNTLLDTMIMMVVDCYV